MPQVIYLADDEKNIRDLFIPFLERDGYQVHSFETGDLLFAAYEKQKPDLVILDIMMPGTDGLTILSQIRQEDSNLPIILLTARDSDADFITGFTLGTDDYFTKPFSPIKLSLHVQALLKRQQEKAPELASLVHFLDMTIDHDKRQVRLSGQDMSLTKTEFDLLALLMENPEMAHSRETILKRIWGFEDIESRAVDDTIKRLRKKMKVLNGQACIKTVWGYGFKMGDATE